MRWSPPVDLSAAEEKLCRKLMRVGRFFVLLRKVRAQLFDEAFQTLLIGMYTGAHTGTEPVAPAQVAMLLLLQGYAKVSDDEAIRRAQMDGAWKMVLDTLGEDDSPASKGTLQNMRNRLIATGMDRHLLAKTIELARATGLFGAKALKGLRLAIDSAPLEGAGRVEDTINLIGHALRNVVRALAAAQGCDDVAAVAHAAGAPVVAATSTKAALDLDWDADDAVQQALDTLLAQVAAVRAYVATQPDVVRYAGAVHAALEMLGRVIAQDTEPLPPTPPPKVTSPSTSPVPPSTVASSTPPSHAPPSAPSRAADLSPPPSHLAEPAAAALSPAPTGAASSTSPSAVPPSSASNAPSRVAAPSPPSVQAPPCSGRRIVQGVARDRLISLMDPEMRHGRKSSTQRIDGYKRYASSDLDDDLILSVVVQPANVAEHQGADAMRADLAAYGPVSELHIDRAFLASQLVRDTEQTGGQVMAKPYPEQTHYGYSKRDFAIDLANGRVTCPAGKVAHIEGDHARFSSSDCAPCPQRPQCQKPGARSPRAIHIHPQEALLQHLVRRRDTSEGRAAMRQRTAIEHVLAHVVFRQGDRARFFGIRKNEFDMRRTGAIFNLQAIDRAERRAAAA
jgi:hypothetical protein